MNRQISSAFRVVSFILIFSLYPLHSNAQYYRLKGSIRDTLKRPIENILVCIKNNEKAFKMTNSSGKFSLKVQKDDTLLMLSPEEEIFQIKLDGRESLVFILKSSGKVIELDQIAHQTLAGIEKERLKEYLVSLKPKPPEKFYKNIYDMIQQEYPDLDVNEGTGAIYIRGQNTSLENNPALIVVDGAKRSNLGMIDPADVASIKVIKDGTPGIYGGRAIGGVIEITTKKGGR